MCGRFITFAEEKMCKKSDFMNAEKKSLRKIDIEELLQFTTTNHIPNFYLSPNNAVHWFLKRESAFLFNGFTIGLCTAGSCRIRINGQDYDVCAGSLLMLPPNQLMEHMFRSADFARSTIVLSLDLVFEFPSPLDVDIIQTARYRPVLHLPADRMEHLLEYYKFLELEYYELDNPYREAVTKTILNAMMLEIMGLYESLSDASNDGRKQRHERLVDDFFQLLAQYYKTERSVAFYSDKMNRTPKYVSGEIKRITGRSIPEWLNEAVLIEMKLQLKTTTVPFCRFPRI